MVSGEEDTRPIFNPFRVGFIFSSKPRACARGYTYSSLSGLFGSVVFFGIENPSIEFFSETKLKGALKIWVSFPVFKVKVDQSELSFNQKNQRFRHVGIHKLSTILIKTHSHSIILS